MRNDSINLRGADILVSQQFADSFDGHPLRKGHRRRKGVAGRVESDPFGNARRGRKLLQPLVAPAVAGQTEYRFVAVCGQIAAQNGLRHSEKTHADFRTRFAAGQVDPCLAAVLLNLPPGQVADVDIGKPREAAEHKSVAHQPQRPGGQFQPHHSAYLRFVQIVAADEFAVQLIPGERVVRQTAFASGHHQHVLERNHVNPRRVLFACECRRPER